MNRKEAWPLLLSVFLISTAPAAAQDTPPIIDVHMHAVTSAERDPAGNPIPIPCLPAGCPERPTIVQSDADVMDLTLEAMDRNNIVLGVLSDVDLSRVYQWSAARPGRFLAGAQFYDPVNADTATLREEFETGRLQVLGEIGSQYAGFAADDPQNEPFFALAESLGVPVHIHATGFGGGSPSGPFRIADGHPERLQEVLVRHPDLRLWIENAGYPFLDEVIALMYRYPNVYADLSTITWIIPSTEFWRYLEALMGAGLGKRLMWGSDQMAWPGAIDHGLAAIREAPVLSDEQKRDILYNNAVDFLRLEPRPGG